jgi:3-oxo-5-alpha-steroid 4-dehydrogenase 3 / polyprenol reductase
LVSPLNTLATYTVPHDWFVSFYFLSLTLCAFWPGEILGLQGPLWRLVRDHTKERALSMSFTQLQTTWAMMLVQSGRRLYECLDLPSSSESQMFVGHWVLGMAFYMATSVAVWVEGIREYPHTTILTQPV